MIPVAIISKGIDLGKKILKQIEKNRQHLISQHDVVVMKKALENAQEIIDEKDLEIQKGKDKEKEWDIHRARLEKTIRNISDELDVLKVGKKAPRKKTKGGKK